MVSLGAENLVTEALRNGGNKGVAYKIVNRESDRVCQRSRGQSQGQKRQQRYSSHAHTSCGDSFGPCLDEAQRVWILFACGWRSSAFFPRIIVVAFRASELPRRPPVGDTENKRSSSGWLYEFCFRGVQRSAPKAQAVAERAVENANRFGQHSNCLLV